MKTTLTILIADPNTYFTLGFHQGLLLHYAARGQNIFITDNMFDKHRADIIFVSAEHNASRLRYLRQRSAGPQHQQIFIIKEKTSQYDKTLFADMDGIFYRQQRLECAIYLVDLAMHAVYRQHISLNHYGLGLTRREVQVIRGLSHGLPLAAIAEHYALSAKTISSHKRRAMTKLGITRTSDLHYWLLGGGLNFLPHTLPARTPEKPLTATV